MVKDVLGWQWGRRPRRQSGADQRARESYLLEWNWKVSRRTGCRESYRKGWWFIAFLKEVGRLGKVLKEN